MPSTKEVTSSTIRTGLEYLKTELQGEKIIYPRWALVVYNALSIAFPQMNGISANEALMKLDNAAAFIVAVNDWGDIGKRASVKRQKGCPQTRFYPLLTLENQLIRHLQGVLYLCSNALGI